MIRNILYISFIICAFNLLSCEKQQRGIGANVWPYDEDELAQAKKRDCKESDKVLKRKVKFFIEHEDEIDLSKYDLIISVHGIVYLGKFKSTVEIPDLCYGDLHDLAIISIGIIDRKNKKEYSWSKKQSYDVSELSKVYIRLKYEKGDYDIKINNDLFYSWF
ncbi:MAG: hypothetical protein V4642_10525 [Bacteroidota bacterium]